MRRLAGMAIALGIVAAANAAAAQVADARLLNDAAFAPEPWSIGLGPVIRYEGAARLSHRVDLKVGLAVAPEGPDAIPHLGFGAAGAGATLTVTKSREAAAVERLKAMGVDDGAEFGDRGRWYLFAAASGRAVGLNMLHGEHGWDRAGWSTDATTSLVGDAQVGVGWRKGEMQTSFGVVHREVKGNHMVFGQITRDDTLAAFTFSIRPGQ